jgi:DNA-binding NtrC family response regulator
MDVQHASLHNHSLIDAPTLLVIDRLATSRRSAARIARELGFSIAEASSHDAVHSALNRQKVDIALLSANTEQWRQIFSGLAYHFPQTTIVIAAPQSSAEEVVTLMEEGASDFLETPLRRPKLVAALERVLQRRLLDSMAKRQARVAKRRINPLSGTTLKIQELHRIMAITAKTRHSALIYSRPGTGTTFVARSIHFAGKRASEPFLSADCRSIAPHAMESYLFGSHPGNQEVPGLLRMACSGTLLIREVAELTPHMQRRLADVLRDKLDDGNHEIKVRILASNSEDLWPMVENGFFRRDLYQLLSVSTLRIPSLVERRDDIPHLIDLILATAGQYTGLVHTLSEEALTALLRYRWPGNIRELEELILRACLRSSGPVLQRSDLPSLHLDARLTQRIPHPSFSETLIESTLGSKGTTLAEIQKLAIMRTMEQVKGNRLLAAKLLGIGRSTLYRRLSEYGLLDGETLEDAPLHATAAPLPRSSEPSQ